MLFGDPQMRSRARAWSGLSKSDHLLVKEFNVSWIDIGLWIYRRLAEHRVSASDRAVDISLVPLTGYEGESLKKTEPLAERQRDHSCLIKSFEKLEMSAELYKRAVHINLQTPALLSCLYYYATRKA